jgi:hypothetical protein
VPGCIAGVTLSPGVTNTEAWSSRLGVGFTALPSKNPVVRKSKEGYGPYRAVMLMMMIMMMKDVMGSTKSLSG